MGSVSISRVRRVLAAVGAGLFAALVLVRPAGAATTLADNGFRSDANGYSLANYGNSEGYRDLTAAEMMRLYGRKVCETFVDGRCKLLPTARRQMMSLNRAMAGGHCFGFAATAQAFFEGLDSPAPFGAPTVPALRIEGNPPLQSYIAYGWSLQALPAVQRATVSGTPAQVVATLRKSLRPGRAPLLIEIFDDGGGHAVTPIALDRTGPKQREIRIYDNNWPGQIRTIHVDLARNTWTYTLGPGTTWSGDAKSQTLKVARFEAGFGHQPCPFCHAAKHGGGKLQLQWHGDRRTGDHSDLFVRDHQGRRAGCGGKGASFRCVNHIPGARIWQFAEGGQGGNNLAPLPTFRLPAKRTYRATLTGHPKGKPAREGLTLTGHGLAFDVHHIRLDRGERSRLRIAHRGRRLRFRSAGGALTPVFTLAFVTRKADYAFRIRARRVVRGGQVGIGLRTGKQALLISATNVARRGRYGLQMARITKRGRKVLAGRLPIRAGQTAVLHYGAWRHGNRPPVTFR